MPQLVVRALLKKFIFKGFFSLNKEFNASFRRDVVLKTYI